MKYNQVPLHDAIFPSEKQLGGTPEKGRKMGWRPTKEQIRNMMHESSEGGRAICYFCVKGFSMKYMKLVRVTAFRAEFACKDCREERNLPEVK